MKTSKAEVWKDIPGYEGKYQASSLGRIRSVDRDLMSRNWYTGKPFKRRMHGRILRPGPVKSGHLYVVLKHGGNGKPVHQLIALTFLGPKPDGTEVCHNNGDPTDNRVENLRYGTRCENILDDFKHGVRKHKLSDDDADYILFAYQNGCRKADLVRQFGVSYSTIDNALRRASNADSAN